MAVSEYITKRLEEAMDKFQDIFPRPSFEVVLRSPNRKGGDREFKLLEKGQTIALVHVKKDCYKMYLSDEQVTKSKNRNKYSRLNGGKFAHFVSIDELIQEIKEVQGYVN